MMSSDERQVKHSKCYKRNTSILHKMIIQPNEVIPFRFDEDTQKFYQKFCKVNSKPAPRSIQINNRDIKSGGCLMQHESTAESSYLLQELSAILLCCIKQTTVPISMRIFYNPVSDILLFIKIMSENVNTFHTYFNIITANY